MRIDDDSYIESDVDLFQIFRQSGSEYGYFKFTFDPYFVSYGFNKLVRTYITENNVTHHIPKYIFNKMQNGGPSPAFYNNFELVKVSHFKREDVREFTKKVKQSDMIYWARWGDAIIRFSQIMLFAKKVKCFSNLKESFSYSHQGRGARKESCIGPHNLNVNDKN